MKGYLLVVIAFLCSCGSNDTADTSVTGKALEVAAEVSTNVADTLCFLRTEGVKDQDTAAIRLIIQNDEVTGTMNHIPFEKDARIGTIKGKKNGDIINGVWTYIQEGMEDSIAFSFRLKGDRLEQKATTFDPASGREVLPDTSGYRFDFSSVDCY